ncbi:MAG: hypothetical protein JW753_00165 [Dehalococcoidia bacterium]|nr:hypothetical protein [Dehalococcoidia bacterium]
MKWQIRGLLWLLLVALTLVVLCFPVNLASEYRSVQAPYIFANLSLFSIAFYAWVIVLVLLAFSRTGDKANWEHLVLAGAFGLVFIGFWSQVAGLYGTYADDIYNSGHVHYLVEEGHFAARHPILNYFSFPGMHLLVGSISETTGLGIFQSRALFLMLNVGLFCSLMYLVFVKLLGRSRLAFLCVPLLLLTGAFIIIKMHIFTPGALGFTLLSLLLLVIVDGHREQSWQQGPARVMAIQVLVFSAMTISYFATSFLVLLILISALLIGKIVVRAKLSLAITSALLFSVVFLAWFVYGAWSTLHGLADFLPSLVGDFRSGEFLNYMTTLVQANLGTALPLWANAVRLFWLGLLGVATIAGLRGLLAVRRLSSPERLAVCGLLGAIGLTLIGIVATEGGSQFARYLLYAPLFAIPLLAGFLARWRGWGRAMLTASVVCVVVLSFPTFLCSVNTVATDALYSYDASSGAFLGSHSRDGGESITIYRASPTTASWSYYYLPGVLFKSMPETAYYESNDAFWNELDQLATDYLDSGASSARQKVFVVDEKTFAPAEHLLAISPDDERWLDLDSSVSSSNRIYSNGHVQMYTP